MKRCVAPTGSGDPDRLIVGDLNSYDHEDPIRTLREAGYTDQIAATPTDSERSMLGSFQLYR